MNMLCRTGIWFVRWVVLPVFLALVSLSAIVLSWCWIHSYTALYWVDPAGAHDGQHHLMATEGNAPGSLRFCLDNFANAAEGYRLYIILDLPESKGNVPVRLVGIAVKNCGRPVALEPVQMAERGIHRGFLFHRTVDLGPMKPGDTLDVEVRVVVGDGASGDFGELVGRTRLTAEYVREVAWPT